MTTTTAQPAQPALTRTVVAGWGLGSFAASTMFQATSVYLLHFLVDYVGLAAVIAGLIFSLTKLYDAVIDPFVGGISDRTQTRYGRRRPYIALGGVICAVSFILMFNLPRTESETLRVALAAGALLLNTTGYAILAIPYLAMPAEMTRDPKERTFIVSYRVAGIALGQIFGSTVAAWIIAAGGGGKEGHSVMAFVLGGTILTMALACFHFTAKAPSLPVAPAPRLSLIEKFRTAFSNRPFALLILLKIFNLISLNFYFGILPFLFITVLKMDYKALGLYFLIQAPCIIASQPLWVRFAKRFGKRATYWLAASVHALGTLSWLLSAPDQPMIYFVLRALVIGLSSGGLLLAGQSMLPDAISEDFPPHRPAPRGAVRRDLHHDREAGPGGGPDHDRRRPQRHGLRQRPRRRTAGGGGLRQHQMAAGRARLFRHHRGHPADLLQGLGDRPRPRGGGRRGGDHPGRRRAGLTPSKREAPWRSKPICTKAMSRIWVGC